MGLSLTTKCLLYEEVIKLLKVKNGNQWDIECGCALWQEPYSVDSVWRSERITRILESNLHLYRPQSK